MRAPPAPAVHTHGALGSRGWPEAPRHVRPAARLGQQRQPMAVRHPSGAGLEKTAGRCSAAKEHAREIERWGGRESRGSATWDWIRGGRRVESAWPARVTSTGWSKWCRRGMRQAGGSGVVCPVHLGCHFFSERDERCRIK